MKLISNHDVPSDIHPRPENHPLLAILRKYHATKNPLVRKALRLAHKAVQISSACDIPLECAFLGVGLILPHRAIGVVIHPETEIGINGCIFHGVTLGANGGEGAPVLGNCVEVGPGAKIFGHVHLGDYVQVAAGAIITRDIPAFHIAYGVNQHKPNIKRFPGLTLDAAE